MKFLDHFKIGEPIAGDGFSGLFVDADDRGIYYDMEDGGITFRSWDIIKQAWNGPPAERHLELRRNMPLPDHFVSREQMHQAMMAAYNAITKDGPVGPALSEDEIRELMAEEEKQHGD